MMVVSEEEIKGIAEANAYQISWSALSARSGLLYPVSVGLGNSFSLLSEPNWEQGNNENYKEF